MSGYQIEISAERTSQILSQFLEMIHNWKWTKATRSYMQRLKALFTLQWIMGKRKLQCLWDSAELLMNALPLRTSRYETVWERSPTENRFSCLHHDWAWDWASTGPPSPTILLMRAFLLTLWQQEYHLDTCLVYEAIFWPWSDVEIIKQAFLLQHSTAPI